MISIKETIVVEGRDDLINLKRFISSDIIVTRGFGLSKDTIKKIEYAYNKNGIIIFTDPDSAGERIRKKLTKLFPKAKHAFISKLDATINGDVGVENALKETIIHALNKVRTLRKCSFEFSIKDLYYYRICGSNDSSRRRDRLGAILGIGYANAQSFLTKLNNYNISREEFIEGIRLLDEN